VANDTKKKDEGEDGPKKKGPLLWIILGVVLLVAGVGGGVFLAPKFMAPAPEAAHAAAEHAPATTEDPPITVQWPPLVVDIRDDQGGSRHIKVVITLEAANEVNEQAIHAFGARGRQAVLGFIRAQKFEDIVGSDKFEALQQKIDVLVKEKIGKDALGKERVQAVLLTDLVAQ
jgi:flagellar protein FliL